MLPLCRKGWGCTDLAAGYHPLTGLQLGRVFLGKAVSPHRAVQMATVCPQCPGGGGAASMYFLETHRRIAPLRTMIKCY